MFRTSKKEIENRVMSVIREKITKKQEEFDEGCRNIMNKVMDDIHAITERGERDKKELADKIVDDILGKVL